VFYERGSDGLPRGWIARMKAAMRNHAGVFNTNRMVRDYTEECYLPSAQRSQRMLGDDLKHAKALASWKEHVRKEWGNVRIERTWTEQAGSQDLRVGDQLQVQAEVYLGGLKPTDVAVELYYGPVDGEGIIVNGRTLPTLIAQSRGKGRFVFAGAITCQTSGRHGYALRIVPAHEDLGTPFEMGLVLWAG